MPPIDQNKFIMVAFKAIIRTHVNNLFEKFDLDRTGYLDYNQARNAIQSTLQEIYFDSITFSDADFDACFKVIDKDGDGKIDKEEMFQFLSNPTLIMQSAP